MASLAQRNRALQAENVNVSVGNAVNIEDIKDNGTGATENSSRGISVYIIHRLYTNASHFSW